MIYANPFNIDAVHQEFAFIVANNNMDRKRHFLAELYGYINQGGALGEADLSIIKQRLTKTIQQMPDVIHRYNTIQARIEKIYHSYLSALPEDITAQIKHNRSTLEHLQGQLNLFNQKKDEILGEISNINHTNAHTTLKEIIENKARMLEPMHSELIECFDDRVHQMLFQIEKDMNDFFIRRLTRKVVSLLWQQIHKMQEFIKESVRNNNYIPILTVLLFIQASHLSLLSFLQMPKTAHNFTAYTLFLRFLSFYKEIKNGDDFPLPVTIPFQVAAVIMTIACLKQSE